MAPAPQGNAGDMDRLPGIVRLRPPSAVTRRSPGLRGPNARTGLRGPNARTGLRGPNAVIGLRGPNAVIGLRGRNAVIAVLAVGVLAGAGGCSNRFGVPDPAISEGTAVLRLWRVLLFAAVALGVVVVGLIFWSLVRYRRRVNAVDDPTDAGGRSDNVPLELFYTAVPLAIVAVLFGLTMVAQRDVNRLVAEPDLRIEVTGFQWGWRFRYLTEGITITGTSEREPTLVLPVRATARLTLMSPDVVHSFYVPEFLTKRDLIPGVENRIDVTPTRTGRFPGVCAEFCGLDHTRMRFVVEVVEPQDFEAFVTQQQETGTIPDQDDQGGEAEPGSQAAPPAGGDVAAPPARRDVAAPPARGDVAAPPARGDVAAG